MLAEKCLLREWALMQSKGKVTFEDGTEGYSCLDCGWKVEVK